MFDENNKFEQNKNKTLPKAQGIGAMKSFLPFFSFDFEIKIEQSSILRYVIRAKKEVKWFNL